MFVIVGCAGLSWSLSLIKQPFLSSVWLNVDVKTDTRKTFFLEDIGLLFDELEKAHTLLIDKIFI